MTGRVTVARRSGFRGGAVSVTGCASLQGPVRAPLVVVGAELAELALQLGCRPGWRPRSQPALQGLVKALGLALGLRVSGRAVLLPDAEQRQDVFERVVATGEAGGVDASVIRERCRRRAVLLDQAQENGDHVIACHRLVDA